MFPPMLPRELAIMIFAAIFTGAPAVAAMAQPANAPHAIAPGAVRPQPAAGARQTQGGQNGLTDVQAFGDWTTRCFPVKSVAPCDMLQVVINKNSKQRITSVSVAYVPGHDDYATQIVVPLGVLFAKGLTLAAGSHKIEGLKFRRCEHDGCYVEVELKKDSIEGLAAGGNAGTISFVLYHGNKPITMPMSLNGFAAALAKLKELSRQKAVTPPPSTTPPASPAPAPAPAQ